MGETGTNPSPTFPFPQTKLHSSHEEIDLKTSYGIPVTVSYTELLDEQDFSPGISASSSVLELPPEHLVRLLAYGSSKFLRKIQQSDNASVYLKLNPWGQPTSICSYIRIYKVVLVTCNSIRKLEDSKGMYFSCKNIYFVYMHDVIKMRFDILSPKSWTQPRHVDFPHFWIVTIIRFMSTNQFVNNCNYLKSFWFWIMKQSCSPGGR